MSELRAGVEKMSVKYGRDPMLVQGAGGNISWKEREILWIKASGRCLAHALDSELFCPVDMLAMRKRIDSGDFYSTPEIVGETSLRPSIETIFHGVISSRVVAHLHSVQALSLLVREALSEPLLATLRDLLSVAVVKYAKPGGDLAQEIYRSVGHYRTVDLILLVNHGIVVCGDSPNEVVEKISVIESTFALFCDAYTPQLATFTENESKSVSGYSFENAVLNSLAADPMLWSFVEHYWAICPDHIVFLGPRPVIVEKKEDLSRYEHSDHAPDVVFVPNVGVGLRCGITSAKVAQLEAFYEVARRNIGRTDIRCLATNEIDALINWEAEKYRQNIQA